MSPPPSLKAPPRLSASDGAASSCRAEIRLARREGTGAGAATAARSARPPPEKKGKVLGVKPKKVPTKRPSTSSSPSAPARGTPTMPFNGAASTASEVFDEMAGSNDATTEFVNLLDTNTVDIDQAPIGDFN
ncbi:hypothetical protein D1007_55117 [Hordeum vulgare]|nr:hypothetical protein D1007_55117 [Hordeum vulgare]